MSIESTLEGISKELGTLNSNLKDLVSVLKPVQTAEIETKTQESAKTTKATKTAKPTKTPEPEVAEESGVAEKPTKKSDDDFTKTDLRKLGSRLTNLGASKTKLKKIIASFDDAESISDLSDDEVLACRKKFLALPEAAELEDENQDEDL